MDLFAALRTLLLAVPGLGRYVGTGNAARVWNSWPRTYATPCLVIELDSDAENNDLLGQGDLNTADVTITCRSGDSHATSDAMWRLVRGALRGYASPGGPPGFVAILNHTAHSEVPKNDGSDAHWYDHVLDFTIQYNAG